MRRMRFLTALASVVTALAGSLNARTEVRAPQPPPSACQIEGQNFDSAAFERLRTVLTDTGDVGLDFASIRDTLGIARVRIEKVVVIADTILCRGALNSWKAFYMVKPWM